MIHQPIIPLFQHSNSTVVATLYYGNVGNSNLGEAPKFSPKDLPRIGPGS